MPGEIVKGARDAEDALKRFKEDQARFVRPVVCSLSLLQRRLVVVANLVYRLLTGSGAALSSVTASPKSSVCCVRSASRMSTN